MLQLRAYLRPSVLMLEMLLEASDMLARLKGEPLKLVCPGYPWVCAILRVVAGIKRNASIPLN